MFIIIFILEFNGDTLRRYIKYPENNVLLNQIKNGLTSATINRKLYPAVMTIKNNWAKKKKFIYRSVSSHPI